MAASLNNVVLVGNLGKDPELRNTTTGKTVCAFSLATNESWTDAQKQKQTRTDWHRIEIWGAAAKTCGEYLKKGRSVAVHGKLRTDKYEKDGTTHFITKIVASTVQFLGAPEKAPADAVDGDSSPDNTPASSGSDSVPF
jgi:single-strand DNA-binding protein